MNEGGGEKENIQNPPHIHTQKIPIECHAKLALIENTHNS